MIDPIAKLNRPPRIRPKYPKSKVKRRKRGPLTQVEKLIVGEMVKDAPLSHPSDKQIDATAIMLRRNPATIKSIVVEAREALQNNALSYVQAHKQAIDQALANQDLDIARKGSEWAIEHISSRDADGKVERIVERAEVESTSPRISIGIALGGLRK